MSPRRPLTEIAHEGWRPWVRPGYAVLDATAGNGLDTAFLAEAVSPGGRVYAIDRQAEAIEATRRLLAERHLGERVELLQGDHAQLLELLPGTLSQRLRFACFNLGYLPGGDHRVTTGPRTTLPALEAVLSLLHPAGALSVITYRGHPGAREEAEAVQRFFSSLGGEWTVAEPVATGSEGRPGPVWWMAAGGRA